MRALLLVLSLLLPLAPVLAQSQLRVLGSPAGLGPALLQAEQAMVEGALPDRALEYRPATRTGWPVHEQLRALRAGLFDLGTVMAGPSWADAPLLQGPSGIGWFPDALATEAAQRRLLPLIDEGLRQRFQAELLALFPVGSSYLFCREPLPELAALKGRSVRHWHEAHAPWLLALGAQPVPIQFDQLAAALREQRLDCAIANLRVALNSGLLRVAPHLYGLPLHTDVAAYAARRSRLEALGESAASALRAAVNRFAQARWQGAAQEEAALLRCLREGLDCAAFLAGEAAAERAQWTPPIEADRALLRRLGREIALPAWLQACEQLLAGCEKRVGPLLLN